MPEPEAIAAVRRFRSRLLASDAAAAKELIEAYGAIWTKLQGKINGMLAEVAEQQMTLEQALKLERLRSLQRQTAVEMRRYIAFADGTIAGSQRRAVELAVQSVRPVVQAALPRGLPLSTLARAGIAWNTLPADAFVALVGVAGNGAPLRTLLEPLGPLARDGIIEGLREGVALGAGPREMARLIRQRFGMPLTRALTISRSETMRAFRDASQTQYQANSAIVRGYTRHSSQDDRVCPACLSLDGKEYDTDELLEVHPGDRCSMVPRTISYRDLGLDVDEPTRPVTGAREWFEEQSEATQRTMLGPGRFDAWKAGKLELTDMAEISVDPTWGPTVKVKPLNGSK